MININVETVSTDINKLIARMPKFVSYILWSTASIAAYLSKKSVFSGNPVVVRTGATRESVGVGRRSAKHYTVGAGFRYQEIAGRAPRHLGILQRKYNYILRLRGIADSSQVSAGVQKQADKYLTKGGIYK